MNAWLNLEINRETDDTELMRDMFTQLRKISKDVRFGLHFTASSHTRDTFFEFVDSFFNIHATDDRDHTHFCALQKRLRDEESDAL